MAKKILSFLCALAVLVSMTAIGLSAVFAEDTTTGEIVFDADNFNFPGTGNTYHGVPTAEGDGLKKYALTARSVSTSANSKGTYNIGDKFDISFSMMMVDTSDHTWTFSVGDLDVVLTNGSTTRITASATYNGQSVIAATALTANVGYKLYNSDATEHIACVADFKTLDTAYTSTPGGMFLCDVTIGYNDGTLTLTVAAPNTTGTTMTGTISNADFTDSDVSIVFNRTDGKWPIHAFHNFTGTYTKAAPPANTPATYDNEFKGLADATINYDSTGANSGTYESAADILDSTVSFTFQKNTPTTIDLGTYNIDGDFEFSYNFIYGFHDSTPDSYIKATLGDLSIVSTAVASSAKFSTAVSYGDTAIGTVETDDIAADPDNNVAEKKDYLQYKKDAANPTNEWATIMDEYKTKLGNNNTYGMALQIQKVTVAFVDGELTVTIGKPDGSAVKTVTGTIADADFSDADLDMECKVVDWRPTAIYAFEGTYEGAAPVEPAVVTFDATKGTVATTTATVNAEGKLETLPTPTYSGAGTYTFEGWFTAAEGGTKVTADTVFAENTTVYAQWKRVLITSKMDTFKEVTEDDITRPEDGTPWNSGGSGPFYVEDLGYGVGCGGYTTDDNTIAANIGTYNIGTYFKTSFDLWYKNKGVANKAIAGSQNWNINIGDLTVTITRSPANITNQEGRNLYIQSVTYKGQEVAVTGDKHFNKSCATMYEWNSQFVIDNAAEHFTYVSSDDMMYPHVASYWGSNNFYPNVNMSFEIEYDLGKLIIKNTTGTEVNTLTADLTAVQGFDAAAAFNNSKVSVDMSTKKEAGYTISLIANFVGEYEVAAAGSGSGSGSGSGTGTGTGSGNAPQTGDNRNVVLPICVAMASVAVAGATLIRRKRA